MSRVLKLKEDAGPTTVDLLAPAGIIAKRGGLGPSELQESHLVRVSPAGSSEVVETYTLNLYGSSQDDAASQVQALLKLLRMASEFDVDPSETTPVYFESQHRNETGARYAKCGGATKYIVPDLYDLQFELDNRIENFDIDLRREHPWREIAPGTTPSAETLTKTSGSVDKSSTILSAFTAASPYGRVTDIWILDASGPTWSANLQGTNGWKPWSIAGSMPAAGDIVYIGGDYPFHNVVIPIETAGVYTADDVAEIWTGAAFIELTNGSQISIYTHGSVAGRTVDDLFKDVGEQVINVKPPETWAKTTIAGMPGTPSKYWIRLRLNSVTSFGTLAVVHSTEADYAQTKNYFEISSSIVGGDTFPRLDFRFFAPNGGTSTPSMSTLSRLLVGVRSKSLAKFESFLWLGNRGNSADWTTAYGTDTSSVTDVRSPTEKVAQTTFATDATLVARAALTGDDLLDDFRGRYGVYLFVEQNGGAAGDTKAKVRFYLGSTSGPYADTPEIALEGVDQGFEGLYLGRMRFPFGEDIRGDAQGIDLVASVFAERPSGAASLSFLGIGLLPLDEWSFSLNDGKAKVTAGGGSLLGDAGVEADFDVLLDRTTKFSRSGSTIYPSNDVWERNASAVRIKPAKQYRFFVYPLFYPTTFGTPPLVLLPGSMLAVEVRVVNSYLSLRGSG